MNPQQLNFLHLSYWQKQSALQQRLNEFDQLGRTATNEQLFEELVYCLFTAGASARMGLKSVSMVRSILITGNLQELSAALAGSHRFPNARANYVIEARNFLQKDCNFNLRQKLNSFQDDSDARRDYLTNSIKGIGYKEASHYLRNIGYRKYAILDKHILNTLTELGVLSTPVPPTSKKRYLAIEERMRNFAEEINIDFDELDLLLWSNKTGEILK